MRQNIRYSKLISKYLFDSILLFLFFYGCFLLCFFLIKENKIVILSTLSKENKFYTLIDVFKVLANVYIIVKIIMGNQYIICNAFQNIYSLKIGKK